MQELYDDMIPGITDTQGGYAQRIADQLEDVVDVTFQEPARNRQDIERQMWAFNEEGLDGVLLVMLTYSPAMRTVRALSENELPVMLANVQPERRITKEWDMDDLTRGPACFGLLAIVYGRKGNDERFDPTYEKRLKERQAEKKSTDDASSAQNEEQSFNTLYTTKKSPAFTLFGDIRRESLLNRRKRLRTRPRCGIASRVSRSYSPVAPRSESFKPDCEGSSDFCRVLRLQHVSPGVTKGGKEKEEGHLARDTSPVNSVSPSTRGQGAFLEMRLNANLLLSKLDNQLGILIPSS